MVFNGPFNEQLSLWIFLLLNKPGVGEGVGGCSVLGGSGDDGRGVLGGGGGDGGCVVLGVVGGCVDGADVGGLGLSGFEPTLLSIQDLKKPTLA